MYRSHAYESITAATIVIGIIVYGLIRAYIGGRIILLGQCVRVFDRDKNPVWYWICFVVYLCLIPLIISMALRYVRNNW